MRWSGRLGGAINAFLKHLLHLNSMQMPMKSLNIHLLVSVFSTDHQNVARHERQTFQGTKLELADMSFWAPENCRIQFCEGSEV